MRDHLHIEVDGIRGYPIARLIGSCTMEVSHQVNDQLAELASGPHQLILVDMSRLDFIESSGLAALVAAYVRLKRRDGQLKLVAPTPMIDKLLRLTRLSDLMPVFDTMDAACGEVVH